MSWEIKCCALTVSTATKCLTGRHPNSERNGRAEATAITPPWLLIEYDTTPLDLNSKLKESNNVTMSEKE